MSRSPFVTDYPSALAWLMVQINYERTTAVPYETAAFKLDRMRRLMGLLGDPQDGLRAVHIAGTKGKGSTAAMVAGILQASGLRTGLYTSPHLGAIQERIAIDGGACRPDEFAALAAEVEEAVARLPRNNTEGIAYSDSPAEPTFFEITTAMAFLHFARQRVGAAVLEVGLGGRLDSTNVCRPNVCIITSISFDHTRQLGGTLAAIAGEKAGIIKPGVPVISGVTSDEPREVIRRVASDTQAPLYERGAAFDFECREGQDQDADADQRLDYREPASDPQWTLADVRLGLLGRHQAANAATAIAAARRLVEQGWTIDEAALRGGLAAARCEARIEVVGRRPTVILDVAHNVASIAALLAVLRERFHEILHERRRILIFASSKDKDTAGMLRLLVPEFDEIIVTRYVNNPRAVEPETLAALAADALLPQGNGQPIGRLPRITTARAPTEAWQLARRAAGDEDLICIAGSFFLAAELRPLVTAMTLDGPAVANLFSPRTVE